MGEGIQTISKGSRNSVKEIRARWSARGNATRLRTNSRTNLQPQIEEIEERNSPKPTKVADLDSRSFKAAITRAHNYTDVNYHQQASATAAKAFGYPDIEKKFRDIEKEHEQAGSLSAVRNGVERVRKLEEELEKRIKRDYGQRGINAWNRAKS